MTVQEIQKLIDNKDWDKLKQINFKTHNTFEEIIFEKDFILDCILKWPGSNITDNFSRNTRSAANLALRKKELGIVFTKDEWIRIFADSKLKSAADINNLKFTLFSIGQDENSFAVYLTQKVQCEKVIIPGKILDNFSKEELEQIGKNLFIEKIILEFEDCDESILLEFVKNRSDIYDLLKNISKIKIGEVFQNPTFSEFKKELTNNKHRAFIENWFKYFEKNKDIKVSDEFLKTYIKYIEYFINNLTIEQIKKEPKILPEVLCKRSDIGLDFLQKRVKNKKYNLVPYLFATEEEIMKNPNLFDPRALAQTNRHYISADTLEVVNKFWETNQAFNGFLTSFRIILGSIEDSATEFRFTLDNLIYLKEKTGILNKEFLACVAKIKNCKDEKIKKLASFTRKIHD